MQTKKLVMIGTGVFILALILIVALQQPNEEYTINNNKETQTQQQTTQEPEIDNSGIVDYSAYNHQFAEGLVEKKLSDGIGSSGTVYFYLPPTHYINVQPGDDYGVAFALNNPNPSNGENYFEYEFKADATTPETCNGITAQEADSWIAMGHKSFGKIPKGWVDMMTVYYLFPETVPTGCNVKYNFDITRDKQPYGQETVEFNIG